MNHFVVHLKLTRHHKSTLLQFFKKGIHLLSFVRIELNNYCNYL